MTAQAHETLILHGNKTSMSCCPSLPKEEPRITESAFQSINSACWRGYVGTWEIKQDCLFLIDLIGNYQLGAGAPIFADWFSGEITVPEGEVLNYVHGGFATVYEKEQRITIDKGVVIKTSTVDNRPTYLDASDIKKFVENRGIKSLLHFTRVANVPGILKHGLLGKESIAKKDLDTKYNDQHRNDKAHDSVCATISHPNYKMFYKLRWINPGEDWAVIRLNPKILWEIPCAFCLSNAALEEIARIPIKERMSFKALESMFQDIPPDIKRTTLGIPDEYTTDPQAEVLILEPVDPNYITDISIDEERKTADMPNIKQLFQPFSDSFCFRTDKSLFSSRKDFKFWQHD